MKLLTALRWLNGAVLLGALSVWLVATTLGWFGRFAKGAAQTAANTVVLFGSGFQTVKRNPPPAGLEWSSILTGLTLFCLWVSVFVPRWVLGLHVCAAAAGLLLVWTVATLRTSPLGQGAIVVLCCWFAYYWTAVWRRV
jgi:hypothetical protein